MPHENFTLYMQYMEGWRNPHVQAFLPGANNKGSREFSSVISQCCSPSLFSSIEESTKNYGKQSKWVNISDRSKSFPVPIFYDEEILRLKANAFYSQFIAGKNKVKLAMSEYNCAGYMKQMFNELGIPIVGDIEQKEKALFFLTRKRPYTLKNIPLPGHVYAEALREVVEQNEKILKEIFQLKDEDLKDYNNLHETEKARVFNAVFKKVLQSIETPGETPGETAEQKSDVSTTQSTKGLLSEIIEKIEKIELKYLNKEELLKDIQRKRYNHFLEKTRFNEWFNSPKNLLDPSIKKVIEDVREKYLSGTVSYSYFLEFIERNLRQIQPQSKEKKQNTFPPKVSAPMPKMPKGLPLTEREEEMFQIDEEIRGDAAKTIQGANDLKKARLRAVLKDLKTQSVGKNTAIENKLFKSFLQKHTKVLGESNKEDLLGVFLGKVTNLFSLNKSNEIYHHEALNVIEENLESVLKDKDIDECLDQILQFKIFYKELKGLTIDFQKEAFIKKYYNPSSEKTQKELIDDFQALHEKKCQELWEEFNKEVWSNSVLKKNLVKKTNDDIQKQNHFTTAQQKASKELYDKLINNEWPDFLSEIAVKGESEKTFDNWIESLRTILTNNNLLQSYSDDTTRAERTFFGKDQTVLLRAAEEDNGQKSLVLGASEHLATLVETLVGEFSNITQVEVHFGEEFFQPVNQKQVEQFLLGLEKIPDSAQVIVKNSKEMLDRIKKNLTDQNLWESLPDQVKNTVENQKKEQKNRKP